MEFSIYIFGVKTHGCMIEEFTVSGGTLHKEWSIPNILRLSFEKIPMSNFGLMCVVTFL